MDDRKQNLFEGLIQAMFGESKPTIPEINNYLALFLFSKRACSLNEL